MTIEGFDPAKFKAANKAGDTTSRTDLRSLNINTTQASTLRYKNKAYFTFFTFKIMFFVAQDCSEFV